MARNGVAQLQEIEELYDGRCPFRPIRHHFGITTFGVTSWTAAHAGDRLINQHDEKDEADELYVVLSGAARFEVAGDSIEAPTGTLVSVAAGSMRTAFAEQPGTTILAIGGGRDGEAYRPGGWELFSPLRPLLEAGRHAELVERALPLLEGGQRYPELLYNVACSEALIGRSADALAHLRQAIEVVPGLGGFAADDEDLTALRDEPEFVALTSPPQQV